MNRHVKRAIPSGAGAVILLLAGFACSDAVDDSGRLQTQVSQLQTQVAEPTATQTPTIVATATQAATATIASPTLTATPTIEPTTAPTTRPIALPTATPVPATATSVPATATPQVSQGANNDYLKVVTKDFSAGPAASVTVEYRASPRFGGQFYLSATIWTSAKLCSATAITDIPASGTATVVFPWAELAPGCTPETFSSVYICIALDGKQTTCINVYK